MGGLESRVVFDINEWEKVGQLRFSSVIRHRATHQELEMHVLGHNETLTERDRQLYQLRKNNKNGWVPVLYHFREPLTGLCSGKGGYYVITEKLERLSDMKQKLTAKEGLNLLTEALHNFGSLVSQFGYFNITAGMMAVDPKGELRVWFNENFSSNSKTADVNQKMDCKTLILSIVKIVSERVEGCTLEQMFEGRSRLNFVEACSILAQYRNMRHSIGKGQLSVYASKRSRHSFREKENQASMRVHTDDSFRDQPLEQHSALSKTQKGFNQSMVVLPASNNQQKRSVYEAPNWEHGIGRQLSPNIPFAGRPSQPSWKKAETPQEHTETKYQFDPIPIGRGHRRQPATLYSSPDVKHTAPSTFDSRFYKSTKYDVKEQEKQPTKEVVKPYLSSDTACQTTGEPEPIIQALKCSDKPLQQRFGSKKSLSLYFPSSKRDLLGRNSTKRLLNYDQIQRIDSVLMLDGSGALSQPDPANFVVIESTILRS